MKIIKVTNKSIYKRWYLTNNLRNKFWDFEILSLFMFYIPVILLTVEKDEKILTSSKVGLPNYCLEGDAHVGRLDPPTCARIVPAPVHVPSQANCNTYESVCRPIFGFQWRPGPLQERQR